MMKQRFKDFGAGEIKTDVAYQTNTGSGWTTSSTYYDVVTDAHFEWIKGYDLDNYHARKRRGELLPMTLFQRYKNVIEMTGSVSATTGGTSIRYQPQVHSQRNNLYSLAPGYLDLEAQVDLADYNHLVNQAASRIYASGWDALTFASEFHKVVRMFTGFRKRLFKTIRRGRLDNTWLEGRYGWRTLLYDIQDLTKVMNNLDSQRKRFSERCGLSTTENTSVQSHLDAITSTQDGEYLTIRDDIEVSVRGMVVADIEPPKFQVNPILTAWEIIPYSFVIDWFVNVGTYLESMSFLSLATNYTAAAGAKIQWTKTITPTQGSLATGWSSSTYENSLTSNAEMVLRVPSRLSNLPKVRVNLDVEKLVDLVALARQLRR